ncbi:MAG TPA: TIGR01777 family oxidoreductase [Acidimicrobiales bacterium]
MGVNVRVGVTGASGLIGAALVEALNERGDTAVSFVRPSSKLHTSTTVRWDPSRGVVDDGDLHRVGPLDAMVNLAGAGIGDRRWSVSRKREILNSRIAATTLLVSILGELSTGGGFLANASAIGWYGSRGDELLTESSPRGEGFLADVCVAWERATLPLEAKRIGVALVRSGVVLSSKGGALKKQLPLFRSGVGGRYGAGDQWMSVISLVDEIRALLWTIDHRLTGPVNFVAPQPLTNKSFTHELARVLHRPAVFNLPTPVMKAVLGGEMAEELILVSQRVLPEKLLSSDFAFEHSNAREALEWSLKSKG